MTHALTLTLTLAHQASRIKVDKETEELCKLRSLSSEYKNTYNKNE